MPLQMIRLQLGSIVMLAMLGCAHNHCCSTVHDSSRGAPPATADELPAVEGAGGRPWKTEPDLSRLPDTAAVNAALGVESAAPPYRELTAAEAQCRAAQNAPRANALVAERRAVQPSRGLGNTSSQRTTSLQRELLAIGAIEDRNRTAGAALEVFYHLAEAEARGAVLNRSLAVNQQSIDAVGQLSERGLPTPVNKEALVRQRLPLLHQQVELNLTIVQLNGQLRHLTGFETIGEPWRFSPQLAWQVDTRRLDVEEAVSIGLGLRPELVLLRTLLARLDADTLPAARQLASRVDGLLGAATGHTCLLKIALRQLLGRISCEEGAELAARRNQIAALLADRERGVTAEIQQAAAKVEAELRRVALTREEVTSLATRLKDLEALRATGGATGFDLTTAELELLRAESDLIARVIAWKIAVVKFKEAQGLLAEECGFVAASDGQYGCCP